MYLVANINVFPAIFSPVVKTATFCIILKLAVLMKTFKLVQYKSE